MNPEEQLQGYFGDLVPIHRQLLVCKSFNTSLGLLTTERVSEWMVMNPPVSYQRILSFTLRISAFGTYWRVTSQGSHLVHFFHQPSNWLPQSHILHCTTCYIAYQWRFILRVANSYISYSGLLPPTHKIHSHSLSPGHLSSIRTE